MGGWSSLAPLTLRVWGSKLVEDIYTIINTTFPFTLLGKTNFFLAQHAFLTFDLNSE